MAKNNLTAVNRYETQRYRSDIAPYRMMRKRTIARWLLVVTAAAGVIAVANISYDQLTGSSQCPQLGSFPACYVVLICYILIFLAALRRGAILSWAFWIGWLGVFALALSGAALELAGTETCPRTDSGTPTCFYSLAIAILLALLFLVSSERNLSNDR